MCDREKKSMASELCHKRGRLRLKPTILKDLKLFVDKQRRSNRFKSIPKTRLPTCKASFLSEIFSVPLPTAKDWAKNIKLSVTQFETKLDLDRGRYEGGFKVWEGTTDLARFINEDEHLIGKLLHENKKLRVLELGCGAGLVSLTFLARLLGHESFDSDYRIHLQDYNCDVLLTLTLLNFAFNLPFDYTETLIRTKCLKFFTGDWSEFRISSYKHDGYDLIMMSETIYDSQNFNSLHELLDKNLKLDGRIVVATKDTYFGLTGGLYAWLEYTSERGTFVQERKTRLAHASIPRSVLVMRRS